MIPKFLIIDDLVKWLFRKIKFPQVFVSNKDRGVEYAIMRIKMHGFVVKVHEFVIIVITKKNCVFPIVTWKKKLLQLPWTICS
jgi:hypothetical protein